MRLASPFVCVPPVTEVVARTALEVVPTAAPREGVAAVEARDAVRPVQSCKAVVGYGATERVGAVIGKGRSRACSNTRVLVAHACHMR